MPYDKKNNIVFIHVPKTAGTSISKQIFGDEGFGKAFSHSSLSDYLREDPSIHVLQDTKAASSDQFIFSVVREPYERFYSFYCNHIVAKRRTDNTKYTLEGFNNFIIKTYKMFLNDTDKKLATKDKKFLEWVKQEKQGSSNSTIKTKMCKNIYGYYYNNSIDANIRFLLFENIKKEYHILIQALKECKPKLANALLKEAAPDVLRNDNQSRHWAAQKSTIHAILRNTLESGYDPIKGDPMTTRGRAASLLLCRARPPGNYHQIIKEIEANMPKTDVEIVYSDLYTPEAKKVFEELNSKDIDFYNRLKLLTAEDRIKAGLNFTEFYSKE